MKYFLLLFAMAAVALPSLAQNRACSLLTADEVRSGSGLSVGKPTASTTPQGDIVCLYRTPQFQQFSISVHEKGGKSLFQTQKAAVSRRNPAAAIAGLGDDAYSTARGGQSSLMVLKGDTILLLNLMGPPDGLPKLQELARKALTRL